MINLGFFPSRRLSFYMVRLFLTRTLAVLLVLTLVLMTLDLLGEAGKILAVPGNNDASLWHYVALRIPVLISRFLPFSVLLGTLIAFVGLNQNSEVVAMKAAGLSAHQILAPLIVASLAIAALLFAFNEFVVVSSARQVNAWSDNDYKPIPPSSGVLSNVWVRDGDNYVRAGIVTGREARMVLHNVSFYDLNGGVLQRVVNAETGTLAPRGSGWLLQKVVVYNANENVVRHYPSMTALSGLKPDQFTIAKVDPTELDYWTLQQQIGELQAAGRPTDEALSGLAHKISSPLSTLLMPLLAAVAAFGIRAFRPGSRSCRDRNGAWLYLFHCGQFQPRNGKFGRLPAAHRSLGAISSVPSHW